MADVGAEAAEPTPEPEPEPVLDVADVPEPAPAAPRIYDADDESGELALPLAAQEPTGVYDVLADDDEPAEVTWREASGPTPVVVDDDPFLTELRRAVTDTEPLGPRDADDVIGIDEPDDGVPSGRFRLRRGR